MVFARSINLCRWLCAWWVALLFPCHLHGAAEGVLVEAETFIDKGGWALDTQAIPSMGSPYLLAHGLGRPVGDASTTIQLPHPGSYRLWVRTRDWVPDHPSAPGQFHVIIEDKPAGPRFGTVPGEWAWQDGGIITFTKTNPVVRLHDLTGFDGRCDALVFLGDTEIEPPNDPAELALWRQQLEGQSSEPALSQEFDLVVVGGGLAGCSAAIAAARQGVSVALVQDRPVLGGNASSEIRVATQGMVRHPIVESVRNHGGNTQDMSTHDSNRLAVVTAESNITLFLGWRAYAANTSADNRILSIDIKETDSGQERRLQASWFVDSTGDGWIGYWAGADFRMGREAQHEFGESRAPIEADAQTMGNSVMWTSIDTGSPVSFPEVPWAMDVAGSAYAISGNWNWEFGMLRDTIYDAEDIRDHLFRAVYGNFYNAKQRQEYANRALDWVCYVPGKRESRRLLGDHILTENDIRNGVFFEDAVGMGSWSIDVHEPTAVDYRSVAIFTAVAPYYFPFRSLYSRNVPNLMMAGRCLSATHVGLGSPRVMHTCGQMGVAVGYAAAVCKKYSLDPREVYRHPDRMLELQLLIGGDWPERPLPLVAIIDNLDPPPAIQITGDWTSSTSNHGFHGVNYMHDGNVSKGDRSVMFTAELPESADYEVYLRWTSSNNRASNVPVTLSHQNQTGPTETIALASTQVRSIRNTLPDMQVDAGSLPIGRVAPDDYYRGLLTFDLSFIPDQASILSASLVLAIQERDPDSSAFIGADGIRIYTVTEECDFDVLTWNSRDQGVPWSSPGGTFSSSPLSIIAEPTDPNQVDPGDHFSFPSTTAFAQAVQNNLGSDTLTLMVRTPTIESSYNARKLFQFATHADPAPELRPVLTVTYATVESGLREFFTIDQRQDGGRWFRLGTYSFEANQPVTITMENSGTDGYVIADAVAFGLLNDNPITDRDEDGLPDWWERWHFYDEIAAESAADSDQDGQSNYAEFLGGTLPRDPYSYFEIQNLMVAVGSGNVLSWPSVTNRTYTVWTGPDLNSPLEVIASGLAATPPLNTFATTPSASTQFYQVTAELAQP